MMATPRNMGWAPTIRSFIVSHARHKPHRRAPAEGRPAMKIAIVSPYDWAVSGGVNNHISHLAEKFVELGHEPHIIAPGVKQVTGGPCPITIIGRPIPLPRERLGRAHHALAAHGRQGEEAARGERLRHRPRPRALHAAAADPVPALLDDRERRHLARGARFELRLRLRPPADQALAAQARRQDRRLGRRGEAHREVLPRLLQHHPERRRHRALRAGRAAAAGVRRRQAATCSSSGGRRSARG